jgi:hypothetical protein
MTGEERFWQLAAELQQTDRRIVIGDIMSSRCLRVGNEFLALYDTKRAGLVVKLPRERVQTLLEVGTGEAFAPAGRVFKEWVLIGDATRRQWRRLLREGIEFVGAP